MLTYLLLRKQTISDGSISLLPVDGLPLGAALLSVTPAIERSFNLIKEPSEPDKQIHA